MRFVIQRVTESSVKVDGKVIGQIGKGFMVLIGVADSDTKEIADKMVKKMTGLRIFEDEEGELGDIFQDEMPFDMNAPVIEILPEDYGIWFVDAMDHPENYEGKTVKFKARVMKPRGMGSKFFVPGRTAMTCCADDTTFLGYVCKSAYAPKLTPGEWVEVTAKVGIEKRNEYQGEEGIVLAAEHVEQCDPLEDEMVYFN